MFQARPGGVRVWSQLLRRLRQEDRLNPGVKGQPGQHGEAPAQKQTKQMIQKSTLRMGKSKQDKRTGILIRSL
jgi:hypothetical protein